MYWLGSQNTVIYILYSWFNFTIRVFPYVCLLITAIYFPLYHIANIVPECCMNPLYTRYTGIPVYWYTGILVYQVQI